MVVSPPSLLPGEGLLLISAPKMPVYHSHHLMRSTSFSPTARLRARRVSRCSAPYISDVSPIMLAPPWATSRSDATPTAGLAVTPLLPSLPPQLVPRIILSADNFVRF